MNLVVLTNRIAGGAGRVLPLPHANCLLPLSLKMFLFYFVHSISVPIISTTVHVLSDSSVQYSVNTNERHLYVIEPHCILSFKLFQGFFLRWKKSKYSDFCEPIPGLVSVPINSYNQVCTVPLLDLDIETCSEIYPCRIFKCSELSRSF